MVVARAVEEVLGKQVAAEQEVDIRMVSSAWEVLRTFLIESRGCWRGEGEMDDPGVETVQLLEAAS